MCEAKYFQQVWKNSTSKSAKTSLLGFKVILTMLNTRWSLFWKFHTKFPPLASAHICHRKHNTQLESNKGMGARKDATMDY